MEQLEADHLTRPTFEEHVVGYDHGGTAVDLEQRLYVLHEIELLVGGGGPEVVALVGDGFAAHVAFLADHLDRLTPVGQICGYGVEALGPQLT